MSDDEAIVIRLHRGRLPKETAQCLRKILRKADLGLVKGLAFVAFVEPQGFIVDMCGEAFHRPKVALRMLPMLEQRLHRRARRLATASGTQEKQG